MSVDLQSLEKIPRHVALIMDGNGRWAEERGLDRVEGHKEGAQSVRAVLRAAAKAGVEFITVYAFSTENWQRPRREVSLLMDLMRNVLQNDFDELNERDVRLQVIGDRSRFPSDLQMQMNRVEATTRDNTRMALNIAANFGGRWDIINAARELAARAAEGSVDPEDIDESAFAQCLSLGSLPAPDICIRTGGEHRISNFLLWDFAYTELYFTDCFWPDFGVEHLHAAFDWFDERQRRFGRRA